MAPEKKEMVRDLLRDVPQERNSAAGDPLCDKNVSLFVEAGVVRVDEFTLLPLSAVASDWEFAVA